jgi:tRNA(Arg) A34 adenosine deaminase TadA
MLPEVNIRLPEWVEGFLAAGPERYPNVEDRMRFVIALSRMNVRHGMGGPFGAAVFDNSGRLVAPGVNMVVASNCCVLHAEVVALVLAHKAVNRYDLSDAGRLAYELVAATEPCIMCFGAVHWSGIKRLVCGARGEDAQAIGFDEGPKPADWVKAFVDRGTEVQRDVLREEAAAVLREYVAAGGPIYNSGCSDGAPGE